MWRYIVEATHGQSEAAASDASSSVPGPLAGRPSISQMLMSKRVRLAVTAAVLFTLALFFYSVSGYSTIKAWPKLEIPGIEPPKTVLSEGEVDWSRFAYTQYATNSAYLCNSVMIFETLFRLGSRADRVLMYPKAMMDPNRTEAANSDQMLLIKARDAYGVKLVPIQVQSRASADTTWAESFTKLLAFNQTQYDRVLNVDSDATILQTMDELFLVPPCPIAMPRAYWLLPDKVLSSQLMLVQPDATEFDRVHAKVEAAAPSDYDMEIVNQLYYDQAMVLPHRPYDLLTGEFRGDNHEKYLGTDREEWDPVKIYNEAKFLHFSDWPVPKPWHTMTKVMQREKQPKCQTRGEQEDCTARDLWNGFYADFQRRRNVRYSQAPSHLLYCPLYKSLQLSLPVDSLPFEETSRQTLVRVARLGFLLDNWDTSLYIVHSY